MKIVLLLAMSFISNPSYSKDSVDKIIASINDEIILSSELKNMDLRIKKVGAIDDSLLLGEKVDSLGSNKKLQLDYLIREKMVESEVKRLNMSFSDERVASDFAQMAKKSQMSAADFAAYLAKQGFALDQYKAFLKTTGERQAFFQKEIISKLRITDEDAFGVFQSKFPNYKPSVGEFKIAQIFFSSKRGGKKEAQARAAAALEKINSGNAFEVLANQLNETPNANKDGLLGSFKTGEFLPEIEKAISNLSPGAVSEVLAGPAGFHIVKLLDKKTILDPNFAKVKESIKASLIQKNFERQLKNWFELKKLEAHIKIYE